MSAFCDTPSVYSCAVGCFLEIGFRLFAIFLRDISHDDRCSNIFEVITRVNPIYEAAISSSDTTLLSQVRKPIWDFIISNFESFIRRNCDAEFSQIFTGKTFAILSHQ